jgi:hypothetical protein
MADSINFSTIYVQLNNNVVLIVFKMINNGTSAVSVDISCDNRFYFDGTWLPSIGDIDDSRGFYVSGNTYGYTFICRSYPPSSHKGPFRYEALRRLRIRLNGTENISGALNIEGSR